MAIEFDPAQPLPGDTVTLRLEPALLRGDPSATQFKLTFTPGRSALVPGLIVDSASGAPANTVVFDVEGTYQLVAFDFRRERSIAASGAIVVRDILMPHEDSPYDVDDVAGVVRVGATRELRITNVYNHDISLRLVFFGGSEDPQITEAGLFDPSSDVAALAALDTGITAAVQALIGETADSIAPALTARVESLRAAYIGHIAFAAPHDDHPDNVNTIARQQIYCDADAIYVLNLLREVMPRHLAIPAAWHAQADTKNLPVTRSARTKAEATVLASDLEARVYERHRLQTGSPASHVDGDDTNELPDPRPLTVLVAAYLEFIAASSPPTPPLESVGGLRAEARLGMSRTE